MKKFFSLILTVVLVAAMFVPSLAIESKNDFSLEDIIENYKPHTEEEITAFKAELIEKDMFRFLIAPDLRANVFVISNEEEPYYYHRMERNIYGDKTQITGVTKDNGFAEMELSLSDMTNHYERYHKDPTADFIWGYVEDEYYTTEKVQYLSLHFDRGLVEMNSQKFLDSLSYEERINFLLDMYLNILDTDEAIGIICEPIYGNSMSGDANGDGNVNAVDSHTLMRYLAGWNTDIKSVNCDIDGNGKINAKDNLYLKKLLIGK